MSMTRVVVTGAAGLVGSIVTDGLSQDYDLTGFDRRRGARVTRRGDSRRPSSLVKAFRDADVVVDMAGDPRLEAPWKSVYRTNIRAAWNTLEAARVAGVRRVVYASSNAVTAGYEQDLPWAPILAGDYPDSGPDGVARITTTMPVRPSGAYGTGKVFAEAACRRYSEAFDLSAICIRIGTVTLGGGPTRPRHFATLLSHRDLVSLVQHAIEAPDAVRFAVVYGVSANTWRIWDVSDAQEVLGYDPTDDAETWRQDPRLR